MLGCPQSYFLHHIETTTAPYLCQWRCTQTHAHTHIHECMLIHLHCPQCRNLFVSVVYTWNDHVPWSQEDKTSTSSGEIFNRGQSPIYIWFMISEAYFIHVQSKHLHLKLIRVRKQIKWYWVTVSMSVPGKWLILSRATCNQTLNLGVGLGVMTLYTMKLYRCFYQYRQAATP